MPVLFEVFSIGKTLTQCQLTTDYDLEKGPLDLFTLSNHSLRYFTDLIEILEISWPMERVPKSLQNLSLPQNDLNQFKKLVEHLKEKAPLNMRLQWYKENSLSFKKSTTWDQLKSIAQSNSYFVDQKKKEWLPHAQYAHYSESALLQVIQTLDNLENFRSTAQDDIKLKKSVFNSVNKKKFLLNYESYLLKLKQFIEIQQEQVAYSIEARLKTAYEQNDLNNGDSLFVLISQLRQRQIIPSAHPQAFCPTEPFRTLTPDVYLKFHHYLYTHSPKIFNELPSFTTGISATLKMKQEKYLIIPQGGNLSSKQSLKSKEIFDLLLRSLAQFNTEYHHLTNRNNPSIFPTINAFIALANRIYHYYDKKIFQEWLPSFNKIAQQISQHIDKRLEFYHNLLKDYQETNIHLDKKEFSAFFNFIHFCQEVLQLSEQPFLKNLSMRSQEIARTVKMRLGHYLVDPSFFLSNGRIVSARIANWIACFKTVELQIHEQHYDLFLINSEFHETVIGLHSNNAILITNDNRAFHLQNGVVKRNAKNEIVPLDHIQRAHLPLYSIRTFSKSELGFEKRDPIDPSTSKAISSVLRREQVFSSVKAKALFRLQQLLIGSKFPSVSDFHWMIDTLFPQATQEWESKLITFMRSINPDIDISYWLWLQKYSQIQGTHEHISQNWIQDNQSKIESAVHLLKSTFCTLSPQPRDPQLLLACYQFLRSAAQLEPALMHPPLRIVHDAFENHLNHFDGSSIQYACFFYALSNQNFYYHYLKKRIRYLLSSQTAMNEINTEFLLLTKDLRTKSILSETVFQWLFEESRAQNNLSNENVFAILATNPDDYNQLFMNYMTNIDQLKTREKTDEICLKTLQKQLAYFSEDVESLTACCQKLKKQVPNFPSTEKIQEQLRKYFSEWLIIPWQNKHKIVMDFFASNFFQIEYYTHWLRSLIQHSTDPFVDPKAYNQFVENLASQFASDPSLDRIPLFDLIDGFIQTPFQHATLWEHLELFFKACNRDWLNVFQKNREPLLTAFETLFMLQEKISAICVLIHKEKLHEAREKFKLTLLQSNSFQQFLSEKAIFYIKKIFRSNILLHVRLKLDDPEDFSGSKASSFAQKLQVEFWADLENQGLEDWKNPLYFLINNAAFISKMNHFICRKFRIAYQSNQPILSAFESRFSSNTGAMIVQVLVEGISPQKQKALDSTLACFRVHALKKADIKILGTLRRLLKRQSKNIDSDKSFIIQALEKEQISVSQPNTYLNWTSELSTILIDPDPSNTDPKINSVTLGQTAFLDPNLHDFFLPLRSPELNSNRTVDIPTKEKCLRFTINPTMASNCYAAYSFEQLAFNNSEAPYIDLIRVPKELSKDNHDTVASIQLYNPTIPFSVFLEKNKRFHWSPEHFTRRFLLTLLLSPAYKDPSKEAVLSSNTCVHEGVFQPFTIPTITINQSVQLNTRNLIFCFDEMHNAFDQKLLNELSSINPTELLHRFQQDLSQQKECYDTVFDNQFKAELLKATSHLTISLDFYITPMILTQLYANIIRLQRILFDLTTENIEFSHLDVLMLFNPKLATFYLPELNDLRKNPLERLALLKNSFSMDNGYPLPIGPLYGFLPNASDLEEIVFSLTPSKKKPCSLAKLTHAQQEMQKGNFTPFQNLPPDFQELLLDTLAPHPKKTVLAPWFSHNKKRLSYVNVPNLNDKLLTQNPNQFYQVRYLNLTECTVSEKAIHALLKACAQVEKITLQHLDQLKNLTLKPEDELAFSKTLVVLNINSCVNLVKIIITANHLSILMITQNFALQKIVCHTANLEMLNANYNPTLNILHIPKHQLRVAFFNNTQLKNKTLKDLFKKDKNHQLLPELSANNVPRLPFFHFRKRYPQLSILCFSPKTADLKKIEQLLKEKKTISLLLWSNLFTHCLETIPSQHFSLEELAHFFTFLLTLIPVENLLLTNHATITEKLLIALLRALNNNTTLKALTLRGNPLSENTLIALNNMLVQNPSLTSLTLSYNQLPPNSLEKLIATIDKNNIFLETLDLQQETPIPLELKKQVDILLNRNRAEKRIHEESVLLLDHDLNVLARLLQATPEQLNEQGISDPKAKIKEKKAAIESKLEKIPENLNPSQRQRFQQILKEFFADQSSAVENEQPKRQLLFNFSRLKIAREQLLQESRNTQKIPSPST